MDPSRFDRWTRRLQSRRRFGLTLAGFGASLELRRSATAAAATPATQRKGNGSFGCSKQDNSCRIASGGDVLCPHAPTGSGAFCVTTKKGTPLCAGSGLCAPCTHKADCFADFGPTAQCIKQCPICTQQMGAFVSSFVVPFTR
jgi:hypothetical protein